MLVVNRFDVTESSSEQFRADAKAALSALSRCTGFVRGRFGASMDDPRYCALVTEWETVGAYRRALAAFDVKMYATPLLARALPEPAAFEIALAADGGDVTEYSSDRAPGFGLRETETTDPDRETAP